MTKKTRKRPPKDSDTYSPGLSKEDKARNHRQAQKSYYERNPLAREKHRAKMAANRKATKELKRRAAKGYIRRRLSTPSWGNLELPPRTEMRTEPRAECNTIYSARSRERIAVEEGIAIDALVALSLSRTHHVAEEWPRPGSDSIMERAMALTSSSPTSPPASLQPAAGNAANAGAENAGQAVREALDAVAELNQDHPLERGWRRRSSSDYYRTFWTRGDHHRFLGDFLSLDSYVAVRRWRLHTFNCTTYDETGEPLESHNTFYSRWPTGIS
ncbi:hypothetical protein B0H16DRAFT_1781961 [Mycena metata]|uniref:Uncharacterized protein n=1 Tax=Mycena metata TaxID=1033252 RepID=A0AAD7HPT1_9AGAR|nr:hypothetical protein B0H16DRAFT_1781961 [Mycena metata]